jgi:ABC-type glycerol-3-phosphate transport system permease component
VTLYPLTLRKCTRSIKSLLFVVVRMIFIVGIAYIILGPIIKIISKSFMSVEDAYSPLVYLIPRELQFENVRTALQVLGYKNTMLSTFAFIGLVMVIQVMVCAFVGYGFARFEFPFKDLLFFGVILTIVVPMHTIMVPLYTQFRYFDVFGIFKALGRPEGISLIGSYASILILTLFGSGLRSGLYIFIFRQFFRGIPKEIEEAALIDGAGVLKTYFLIMLPNAIPAIVTVMLFSFVWQYNDTAYASLLMPNSNLIAVKLTTLGGYVYQTLNVKDPILVDLVVNAGILFTILPVLALYLILQKYFVEGVERSGIVG